MADQTVTRAFARDPRDKNPQATEFSVSATVLIQDVEVLDGRYHSAGPYILLTHAIELALKGYLLCNGVTKEQLANRRFGHKLTALLQEAKINGLVLSDPEADKLIGALDNYTGGAALRYTFGFSLPIFGPYIPVAKSIIADTKPPLPTGQPAENSN
jgi:hypothetical protein